MIGEAVHRSGDSGFAGIARRRSQERRNIRDERGRSLRKGLDVRRDVLGAEHLTSSLAMADKFMTTFQHAVTELAWGYAWSRPGFNRRTRLILTIDRDLHEGAIRHGVTAEEIKEILIHVTAYCGRPEGRHSFLAAHEALTEAGALP
jgi:4-carboxymuconolactone decarboxylase